MINTTHNVSQKLCLAAARILRKVSAIADDSDASLDLETVTYLLEDTNIAHTPYRNKISTELAGERNISGCFSFFNIIFLLGTLKNLKKLEQAFDVLNNVLHAEE